MLMSAVFAQSDCNKNNWQDYYNSDGKDMSDCDLRGAHLSGRTFAGANLTGANLTGANLTGANLKYANIGEATFEGANLTDAILDGVQSGNISEYPQSLPDGWSLVDGTLENRELSDEIFRQINEGNAIKKSKWRAWKK